MANGNGLYYFQHFELEKSNIANQKWIKSYKCLLYWNGLMIILSVIQLGLFLWQTTQVTKRINTKHLHAETKSKVRINVAITSVHIFVILAVAIIYLVEVILFYGLGDSDFLIRLKIITSATFIVGVQDIFVICMLWSVMDSKNKPLF